MNDEFLIMVQESRYLFDEFQLLTTMTINKIDIKFLCIVYFVFYVLATNPMVNFALLVFIKQKIETG